MERGQQIVRGLRKLADFLEDNPSIANEISSPRLDWWAHGKDDFLKKMRLLGDAEKRVYAGFFNLRKEFGGGVALELSIIQSEVCRIKSEKQVLVPAQPEYTRTEIEWECPESLLAQTSTHSKGE